MELNSLVRVARGDAPADLVLRNARLVNVYSGEIYPADVAIHGARIAGIGPGYDGAARDRPEGQLPGARPDRRARPHRERDGRRAPVCRRPWCRAASPR